VAALVALAVVAPGARAQEALDLEGAIRTALVRNPSVESAEAAAAAAASARWADWGAFLPTARASASLARSSFTNVTYVTPEGSPATIDPPLEDVSKSSGLSLGFNLSVLQPERFAAVKAGAARSDAATLRLRQAERVLIRDVKRAYFEALKQQRLVELAERQLEARRQDLEMTRERYRIAAAMRSDLLGAEMDAGDAELRLLDARQGLAAGLRALRVLMAGQEGTMEPVDVELQEPGALPSADSLDADALVHAALDANPEIRALQRDADAASASLWSARATYLPRIDLGLTLARRKELGQDQSLFDFNPANTSTSFSITGSWSLFEGFSRKRQMAEASRALTQARSQRRERSLGLEREIRNLVEQIRSSSRRLELLDRSRSLAEERLELAREQYRLGSIPYFNLQQAIDRLTQAEQSLFQERYDTLVLWAELEERAASPRPAGPER
jgi:outer membrane protein TolC